MGKKSSIARNINTGLIVRSISAIFLAVISALLAGYIFNKNNLIHFYIEKNEIHSKILIATRNGASLDV